MNYGRVALRLVV